MNSTNEMISAVCHGKSFADIGPLWGVQNEKLSVAHDAGATRITAFDGFPSEHPIWSQFRERMANKKSKISIASLGMQRDQISSPNVVTMTSSIVQGLSIIFHHPCY